MRRLCFGMPISKSLYEIFSNYSNINEIEKYGLIYDVGIDNKEFSEYSYRPLNLYEICLIMKKREDQINKRLNST